jgi:thymidylate synthase ThyX
MPHNKNLIPKISPFRILFGQIPLTKFKDYRSNIKVDLIYAPDRNQIMPAVYDFVKATWSEDGKESSRASYEEMSEAFKTMLEGKALGLGIETIDFIFRISGITRIDTHQIVRQRIGVTFSQQCTGDRFLNHADALVEECIAQDKDLLDEFIRATLATKMSYANMNDSMKVSIQTSREILPHNLETFIFMKINLMTFLMFHKKRIDDGSQTWPMNVITQQMSDGIIEKYPELKSVLEKNKTSFKFQTEASKDRGNTFSTSLYLPKNDDEFEFHNQDFLYSQKKDEMNFTETPIRDRYFWGYVEISENLYNEIKNRYENLDKENKTNRRDNKTIQKLAENTNESIILKNGIQNPRQAS